jgi:hypothetical protein
MPNTVEAPEEPRCKCNHTHWFHAAKIIGEPVPEGYAACVRMDCTCMGWKEPHVPNAPKHDLKSATQPENPINIA